MNYAGFWIRSLAFLIDLILWNVIGLIPQYLIAKLFNLSPFDEQIFGEVLSLVVLYFYYVWYQSRTGTTPGKKLFNLSVVSEKTGMNPTQGQCVVRAIGYLISAVVLGCGYLMAAFHPQKKTLHDLMARTKVVSNPKVHEKIA